MHFDLTGVPADRNVCTMREVDRSTGRVSSLWSGWKSGTSTLVLDASTMLVNVRIAG